MMAELAPQAKNGSYSRPSYTFEGRIGDKTFPDEPGRYHLFVGTYLIVGAQGLKYRKD